MATNAINFCALSYDGTNYAFYVNAVNEGSGTTVYNLQTTGYNNFGLNANDNGELFAGTMKDARVYTSILTQSNLQLIYNYGPHP